LIYCGILRCENPLVRRRGLRGVAFTVLLLRPVPRHDEFRRQGHNLLVTWSDQGSSQKSVEVFRAAV
jgi:hypothetical protein